MSSEGKPSVARLSLQLVKYTLLKISRRNSIFLLFESEPPRRQATTVTSLIGTLSWHRSMSLSDIKSELLLNLILAKSNGPLCPQDFSAALDFCIAAIFAFVSASSFWTSARLFLPPVAASLLPDAPSLPLAPKLKLNCLIVIQPSSPLCVSSMHSPLRGWPSSSFPSNFR